MTEGLRIAHLRAGHGQAVVIPDLSLSLDSGQALAVLGRNGVGKTTLIDSIIGVTDRFAGRISLNGRDITALPAASRARAGIGWVPQERAIFRSLSVAENLTVAARPGPWTLPRIWSLFPRLAARQNNPGRRLSGGEQQMLAVARALMGNPRLLLLDEPTEGLAPRTAADLLATLATVIRDEGMTTVIVEQHAQKILPLTDRAIILDRGRIVHDGDSRALAADPATLARHLGIGL